MKNISQFITTLLAVSSLTACSNYKFSPVTEEFGENKIASTPDDVVDLIPPTPNPIPEPIPEPVKPPVPVVPAPIPAPTPVPAPVVPVPTPPQNTKITESYSIPVEKPQADILLILDTSGSMSRNLEKMAGKFHKLISKWQDIDWQLSIINPAVNPWDSWAMMGYLMSLEGKSSYPPTVLKKTDFMPQDIFERNVSHGQSQSCAEGAPWCMSSRPEPLKTMMRVMAQRNEERNRDFFRPGSYFVPIILSDSDENENGVNATQPSTVVAEYQKIFGNTMKPMVGFSIVVPPGDVNCYKEESNFFKGGLDPHYGVVNSQFAQVTGGFTASICDKDYSSSLEKISEHLRVIIDQFLLKNTPLSGTLKVTLIPEQPGITWKLDGKKLIFSKSLPSGTEVKISYEIKANSSAK